MPYNDPDIAARYEEFRRIFMEFGLYWGAVNIAPSKPALTPV